MEDAKYINLCNHRLTSVPLTIIDNGDGTFSATLPYPAITHKAYTFIRTYNDEKAYFYDGSDYTSTLNYSYKTVTGGMDELPEAGVIRKIGITNYEFVSPTQILFGTDAEDPTIEKVVVNPDLVPQPIYLIDYAVTQEGCPLCKGQNAVQDISFDGTGEVRKSTGKEKIVERVLKALVTRYGDQPEDLLFGSGLDNLIGTELDITASATIQKAVYDTVNHLISLQAGVDLEEDETIISVQNISIVEGENNPGLLKIKVVVKNALDEDVPCIVTLGVN